jgi:hypothetical protein
MGTRRGTVPERESFHGVGPLLSPRMALSGWDSVASVRVVGAGVYLAWGSVLGRMHSGVWTSLGEGVGLH